MGTPSTQLVVGGTYPLLNGEDYYHKPDHHRIGNKSRWNIACTDEQDVLESAFKEGWIRVAGWGLYFKRGRPQYLGRDASDQRDLFIGKFVKGQDRGPWHGYPADHVRHRQDVPPNEILADWMNRGHLNMAKRRKLEKGRPCSL